MSNYLARVAASGARTTPPARPPATGRPRLPDVVPPPLPQYGASPEEPIERIDQEQVPPTTSTRPAAPSQPRTDPLRTPPTAVPAPDATSVGSDELRSAPLKPPRPPVAESLPIPASDAPAPMRESVTASLERSAVAPPVRAGAGARGPEVPPSRTETPEKPSPGPRAV